MKRLKQILICIAALLMLFALQATAAETDKAEDLTKSVSFDFGKYKSAKARVFNRSDRYQIFPANASFSLSWKPSTAAAQLCIEWQEKPVGVEVLQYGEDGALLRRDALAEDPDAVVSLDGAACKAVVQAGEAGMQVRFLAVYGEGELPGPFYPWKPLPDRIDYLLISTHPDDDVLFLGSVVPVYGAERGYIGTIVYVTNGERLRIGEAEDGAWTMGLRYRPVFLWMQDVWEGASKEKKAAFRYEELLLNTVRLYRRLKPVVVFAQDEKGEYGHWQHKLTSKASREAFALAADPTFDPESAEQYGVWQVQKLFLHKYKQNQITIDARTPLAFFNGKDAYQVAKAAYKKHKSQQRFGFAVERDTGSHPFNHFGMAEGVVPAGEDVFDNVEPSLLSDYVPPTPTPEPTPTSEPTPEPTPEPTREATPEPIPTAEPTAQPELTPIAENVPEPTAKPAPELTPAPVSGSADESNTDPILWIAIGAAAIAVLGGIGVYICIRRRGAKS